MCLISKEYLVDSQQVQDICLIFKATGLALGSVQPIDIWVKGDYPKVNVAEFQADHLPKSSREIKSELSCTSTTPCAFTMCRGTVKRYSNPIIELDKPLGLQEFEAPRFQDSLHMKVVMLSGLGTGRLYPPGNIPGTHFR